MKKKLPAGKHGSTRIFSISSSSLQTGNHKSWTTNYKLRMTNRILYPCLIVFICGLIFFCLKASKISTVSAGNSENEIEKAIFTRAEFFGAEAIVPLPTSEARENLSKILENQPDNPQLLEKLADFNEKLERYDEAENDLRRLSEIDPSKLEKLIAFYRRRADLRKKLRFIKVCCLRKTRKIARRFLRD